MAMKRPWSNHDTTQAVMAQADNITWVILNKASFTAQWQKMGPTGVQIKHKKVKESLF